MGMIFDLDYDQLTAYLGRLGEPSYRAGQIWSDLFQRSVDSFAAMETLPTRLRQQLEADHPGSFLRPLQVLTSRDGSRKFLWQTLDGERIESVFLQTETGEGSWTSACLSTQAGCPIGCFFCATGQAGYHRNLTSGEILAQLAGIQSASGQRVGRLLLMGMGEPLLNTMAVCKALTVAMDPRGLGLGGRRITLSTVGPKSLPDFLESVPRVEISLSLHAPDDALRATLIPRAKTLLPIHQALQALADYRQKAGRYVTVEYLMLAGVNDRHEQADMLADLLAEGPFFVNLLPFNSSPGLPFQPSPRERIREFAEILRGAGLKVKIRKSRGADVAAACGQLGGGTISTPASREEEV
jgi:23S rRNA (adenine2503-C2)-methyltransferase